MPTYIGLTRYTQQGIATIKNSPARLDGARAAFAPLGVTIREFFLVSGSYDLVLICEAPDDASMARAALLLGSHGNVRSETFRAFTEAEYRSLLTSLP